MAPLARRVAGFSAENMSTTLLLPPVFRRAQSEQRLEKGMPPPFSAILKLPSGKLGECDAKGICPPLAFCAKDLSVISSLF